MSLTTTPISLNATDHNTSTSSHAGASLVAVEHLTQLGREGLRLPAVAELATEEAAVVAREHGRGLTEQLRGGHRRATREHAERLLADRDDDAGRRRDEPVDVGAVAADRPRPVGEQGVAAGAVVLGRHAE